MTWRIQRFFKRRLVLDSHRSLSFEAGSLFNTSLHKWVSEWIDLIWFPIDWSTDWLIVSANNNGRLNNEVDLRQSMKVTPATLQLSSPCRHVSETVTSWHHHGGRVEYWRKWLKEEVTFSKWRRCPKEPAQLTVNGWCCRVCVAYVNALLKGPVKLLSVYSSVHLLQN